MTSHPTYFKIKDCFVYLLFVFFIYAGNGFAQNRPVVNEDGVDREKENLIHTPVNFDAPGVPKTADEDIFAWLKVTVIDQDTQEIIPCRINLVGVDGNFYEPDDNVLKPWSLHRTGNREGKGPFRYYGWFFYTTGEFKARVPAGELRIEIWRGFEYTPVVKTVQIQKDTEQEMTIPIQRTINMAEKGWYSGDTHIHLNRRNIEEENRALDLIQAEDIRFGFLLCMNDPKTYMGMMMKQIWPQLLGMGRASVMQRGDYQISSGQEYRCNTYGHICLLLGSKLVLENQEVNPNEWPLFASVAEEIHRLGGTAIHAHGGYEKEIYADFAQESTDGVELLQFAEYRSIGLEGWYHILNAGYRFPAVGASDYPYCRALGDCRTYVRLDSQVDFESWLQGIVKGNSFFTTGPMLFLTVNGHEPGDTVSLDENTRTLNVEVEVQSAVADVETIEIVANGKVVHKKTFTQMDKKDEQPTSIKLSFSLPAEQSTWIAARAYSGVEDSEAHTNPVYFFRNGKAVYKRESVDWLLEKLEKRITDNAARTFERKEDVLRYFKNSKNRLLDIQSQNGMPVDI